MQTLNFSLASFERFADFQPKNQGDVEHRIMMTSIKVLNRIDCAGLQVEHISIAPFDIFALLSFSLLIKVSACSEEGRWDLNKTPSLLKLLALA